MTLEPRKVEPEALKRWLKEAWALMRRSFLAWLALAAGAALLFGTAGYIFVSGPLMAIGYAVAIVCCGVLLIIGVDLAARTDQSLAQSSLFSTFSKGAAGSTYLIRVLKHIFRIAGPFILVFSVVSGGYYVYLYLAEGEVQSLFRMFPKQQGLARWLIPFSFVPLAMANVSQFLGYSSHIDRYLLAMHGVSWDASEILVRKAKFINRDVDDTFTQALQIAILALIMLGAFFLLGVPNGAILGVLCALPFPLIPCLIYVRFRDIYLGRTENKPEAVKERSSIPAKAVGSQA